MVQPAFPSRTAFAAAATVALLLSVGAVLLVTRPAAAAGAAATPARATLTLDGTAAKRLRAAGVTVSAAKKATVKKRTATLPVSVSVVSTTAVVGLNGTITFRAGARKVTLTGLRVMVSKRRALQILARTTGSQFAILTGTVSKRALALDAFSSTASFTATSVKMTSRLGRLLRSGLRLKRAPTGTLGALTLHRAAATATSPGRTPTSPGPTTPGTTTPGGTPTSPGTTTPGTTTPGTTTPTPGSGPRPCTATAPASTALSEPGFDPLKPLNAVGVSSACITWHPRDSWIDYTSTGQTPGDGATVSNGATADPANTACGALLPREFHFPFHQGWFVPSTGQAALQFDGTVRFRYAEHTIDISFQNPEVQLAGATATTTFRRAPGAGGRLTVLDLDPSGPLAAQCRADPGPKNSHDPTGVSGPRTYERLHATLSASAAPMFDSGGQGGQGALYPPGDDFGWLSVSFTPASS